MTRVTQTWRYAFDNAPRVRSGSSRPERRERPNEVPVAIGDDELPVTNFARPRPVPPLFERNLDGVAGVSDAAIRAVDVIHLELSRRVRGSACRRRCLFPRAHHGYSRALAPARAER